MSNATRGETANYYNSGPEAQDDRRGYGAQPAVGQAQYNGQQAPQDLGEKRTFDQTFKIEKPKWNDLWAGVLFLVVMGGFVAVSGLALHGYAATKAFNGGGIYDNSNNFGLSTNTIVMFMFCLAVAIVLSYVYIWLARIFTKQFIWITGILNIVFGLVTAIYMLSRRYWSGGIVFLVFSLFAIFCFISWIPRIPFSVLMLRTSIDVSKRYGHVYLVSFIGGLIATIFGVWFSITLVAIYDRYQVGNNPNCRNGGGGCSSGKVIGLIVFVTFASYWFSEWLKNTIHTTISGVYGSWYFSSKAFPRGATRGALKRSLTYSFGSISLGSLIVALINMLRQACSIAQQTEGQQGNIIGSILFCVLGCFISLLDWAVQFINRYAFSHIALYGKAYVPAAKDTWQLMKNRGIDALVNDCLIGPVMSMGATFIAYACALLAYLYLIFTHPSYNHDGAYTPVVVAFAFLVGLQICHIVTTPISSGIDTIFVAAAWDPEVLMRDHPDLYAKMIAVYPHVQQAIHV